MKFWLKWIFFSINLVLTCLWIKCSVLHWYRDSIQLLDSYLDRINKPMHLFWWSDSFSRSDYSLDGRIFFLRRFSFCSLVYVLPWLVGTCRWVDHIRDIRDNDIFLAYLIAYDIRRQTARDILHMLWMLQTHQQK